MCIIQQRALKAFIQRVLNTSVVLNNLMGLRILYFGLIRGTEEKHDQTTLTASYRLCAIHYTSKKEHVVISQECLHNILKWRQDMQTCLLSLAYCLHMQYTGIKKFYLGIQSLTWWRSNSTTGFKLAQQGFISFNHEMANLTYHK